jgi:nucleoside-diphosphate-sugar epimerase
MNKATNISRSRCISRRKNHDAGRDFAADSACVEGCTAQKAHDQGRAALGFDGLANTLRRAAREYGMRILVTGGSGFIGTNVVEDFASRGEEVLNLDIEPPRNSRHDKFWRPADLRDTKTVQAIVREFSPQWIVHLAARTDLDGRSLNDYGANTRGVENLVAAVEGLSSVRRVIFASSRLVCRIGYLPRNDVDYCPTTIYGQSKVVTERIVRSAGVKIPGTWLIVRPTSIWGPWFDTPYRDFFLSIAKGRYVHPCGYRILKSFGFVGNTVYQLRRLLEAPDASVAGRTYYLADYPPIDVLEMAQTVSAQLDAQPIREISVRWLRAAARIGDALKRFGWRNPPLTTFRLVNLLTPMVYDLDPLKSVVGDLPYTMVEGIEITIRWLREHTNAL